jgi:hypothetical protein
MNEYILDLAAVYVNSYRTSAEKRGLSVDKVLLRRRVTELFGAAYAAILVA